MNNRLSILSLLVASLSFTGASQTVFAQTVQDKGPWYEEGLYSSDITAGSMNPADRINLPYKSVNDIKVTFESGNGDFRPYDAGTVNRITDVDIYGIKKFDDLAFEGGLEYSNNYHEDMRWNGTVLTSALNPFLIADTLRYDSLTNDSRKELFRIRGSVAYRFSDRITAGISAEYKVAHKADQSDPRLRANAARTTVIPGINWNISDRIVLGASALAELYHERVRSTVENNMVIEHNTIYRYKALGGYDGLDAIGATRYYDGKRLGGALNFATLGTFSSYTEIGYIMNSEDAIDGKSSENYDYRSGDFSQNTISLKSRLTLTHSDLQHNLVIWADMENCKGKWYNQQAKTDQFGKTYYEINSSEVIHKQSEMNASLTYLLNFMRSDVPHMHISATAGYRQVDVKQYPDENYAKYTMLTADLGFGKNWSMFGMRFKADVNGGMNHALKPLEMEVATGTPLDRKILNGYYKPKYTYLSAQDYHATVSLSGSYPLELLSQQGWLTLTASGAMQGYTGDDDLFKDADRKSFTLKLNYTF